jgi:NAD(P)-dependent dehydrogenase (short-subunit alcohol dehydrogenase family)
LGTVKVRLQEEKDMEVVKIEGVNAEPFAFEWKYRIDLSEKVILAFGGGGNLSETFLYAASLCGARVVIVDLPPKDGETRAVFEEKIRTIALNIADLGSHGPARVLYADVTDLRDVEETLKHTVDSLGRIDLVVDFAGVHHPPFNFYKGKPEEILGHFRRVVEINLTGAFIVTMLAARYMIPQRDGQIIHICSSGSRLSLYGSYAYNSTKHAVEGLVKTAAAQLAPFNLRVNGIAPGTVETDLNRSLLRNPDGSFKPRALTILAHTPSKKFITREGVAETLLAMCLPQRHFTGNVVFADDGYNVEGHSWPEGNLALYEGPKALEDTFRRLDIEYPKEH